MLVIRLTQRYFGVPSELADVVVTSVVEGGCASERGMHAGLKRKRVLKVTVLVADMPDSNLG